MIQKKKKVKNIFIFLSLLLSMFSSNFKREKILWRILKTRSKICFGLRIDIAVHTPRAFLLSKIWICEMMAIAVKNIVFRHLSGRNYRNFEVSMERYLFDSCATMWEFSFFPLFWRSLMRKSSEDMEDLSAKRKTLIEFISSSQIFRFFFEEVSAHAIFWKIIEFLSFARSPIRSDINFMKSFKSAPLISQQMTIITSFISICAPTSFIKVVTFKVL